MAIYLGGRYKNTNVMIIFAFYRIVDKNLANA